MPGITSLKKKHFPFAQVFFRVAHDMFAVLNGARSFLSAKRERGA